jgi:xylan 1,4-beta-xylosidase
MTKNRLFLTVILSLIFSTFFLTCKKTNSNGNTATPAAPTITVDASQATVTTNSMVGFIHGMNSADPDNNLINDLKPAYWRAGTLMSSIYPRINQLSAKPIIVISDPYRYPGDSVTGWQQPFNNSTGWTDFVANIYTQSSAQSSSFIYDIWNEPNAGYCWTGTRQQFFQTFKLAHDKIRSLPNGQNALIAGPSVAGIDTSFMHEFLEYCLANSIKLDILTWHDFRTGYKIPSLKDNLLQIRNEWVNSSRYAALQIKAIHINEIIGEADQVNPAAILAYFDALEKGKADAACKACWNETNAADNNCFKNTLDGLLTQGTYKKRSAWWAYYYYALTTSKRYTTTIADTSLVCFAAIPSNNNNQLLLAGGYFGDAVSPVSKNITLAINNISNLSFIGSRTNATVTILKIPFSGFNELIQPTIISNQQTPVTNGKITITVPSIGLKDAFVIQIE